MKLMSIQRAVLTWAVLIGTLGPRVVVTATELRRLGEETIGNGPLAAENYRQWPEIVPMVNHSSRVYQCWINGDERMYYDGSIETLNALLKLFAAMPMEPLEIVVLPGPGLVTTFDGGQEFKHHCDLHLVSGMATINHQKDKGDVLWPKLPRLTLRIDATMDLQELRLPTNCRVVSMNELKLRYISALDSSDPSIRAAGLSSVAELDPYDQSSLKLIADRLADTSHWGAFRVALCLPRFGPDGASFVRQFDDRFDDAPEFLQQQWRCVRLRIEAVNTEALRKSFEEYRDAHEKLCDKMDQFLKSQVHSGPRL